MVPLKPGECIQICVNHATQKTKKKIDHVAGPRARARLCTRKLPVRITNLSRHSQPSQSCWWRYWRKCRKIHEIIRSDAVRTQRNSHRLQCLLRKKLSRNRSRWNCAKIRYYTYSLRTCSTRGEHYWVTLLRMFNSVWKFRLHWCLQCWDSSSSYRTVVINNIYLCSTIPYKCDGTAAVAYYNKQLQVNCNTSLKTRASA